jgi:hypothetical protein
MKTTVKVIVRFCGVEWIYLPQDTVHSPATTVQPHDRSGSTEGEDFFFQFSDCVSQERLYSVDYGATFASH